MKIKAALLFLLLTPLLHVYSQYMELGRVLQELQADLQWNPEMETGVLKLNRTSKDRVIFKIGAPWVLVNYEDIVETSGVIRRNGAVLFPKSTIAAIQAFFTARVTESDQPRIATILIDAGHGGKDSGAIGVHEDKEKTLKILEKDVVLNVALNLHRMLLKNYPAKEIILTRNDDTYLKLEERTSLANNVLLRKNEATIFVSIHANAAFNRKAKGYEVWVLPQEYRRELIDPSGIEEKEIAPILNVLLEEEYSVESTKLAQEVLNGFDEQVGDLSPNRGIREESWFVVRNAKMPSILIELGYVTNFDEALLLSQESYLQKLSLGIYTGIRNFVQTFENTKGFTE